MGSLITICPERDFLAELVPLVPAGSLVLLPNRRTADRLRARLAVSDVHICPIGDIGAYTMSGRDQALSASLEVIPPAISGGRRLMQSAAELWRLRESLDLPLRSMEQAARFAGQLLAQLDELDREEVPLSRLDTLSLTRFSTHAQRTIAALLHLACFWEGQLSPLARRNRITHTVAHHWRENPPDYPVIAAGSTGAQTATAGLLAVISQLPQGRVVLQGLDTRRAPQSWETMGPDHPQYPFKRLLACLARQPWEIEEAGGPRDNTVFVDWLDAMAPAPLSREWAARPRPPAPIQRIDLVNEREEAALSAQLLSEAADSGQRAALVSPDSALIRRVRALLATHHIPYSSAVGRSAAHLPAMRLLLSLAEAATRPEDPAALLAMLQDPFCHTPAEETLQAATRHTLETRIARGLQPRLPWRLALARLAAQEDIAEAQRALIAHWHMSLEPLAELFSRRSASAEHLLDALMQAADSLSRGRLQEDESWQTLWPDVQASLAWLGTVEPAQISGLLSQALALHPQIEEGEAAIHLLSPLEARLLRYDRVVLAGLNEGTWPRAHSDSYAIPAPMREPLGLPPAEAGIGLQAYDFLMQAAGAEVYLLAAQRRQGTQVLPARWLERYDAMAGIYRHEGPTPAPLAALRADEAAPAQPRPPRPAPCPPAAVRPARVSISDMELWLRDPYAIYAKHILKLTPLEPLDQPPDAALRGSIIHRIWERFVHAVNDDPARLNRSGFEDCARAVLRDYSEWPLVTLFWTTRIHQMGEWIVALEAKRREGCEAVMPEEPVHGRVGTLTLYGQIDRLERSGDEARIIDYKTGQVPTLQTVELGYGGQLPLLGLLLRQQSGLTVSELTYLKLGSGTKQPEEATLKKIDALMAYYEAGISQFAQQYAQAAQPFYAIPNPAYAPAFSDYAHLERVAEWG